MLHHAIISTYQFPLFIRRDQGTIQFFYQDKNILATIFVMKTNQLLRPFSTTSEETIC